MEVSPTASRMVEVPESNELSAVWNDFQLGALLDDSDDGVAGGAYYDASPSATGRPIEKQRHGDLHSVLRRVGPSPEKKEKIQLPYMKAMVGRYGTLPAERKIADSRVIDRLADKYANLDLLSALTPRTQARRREKAERDVEEARRERERKARMAREKHRNPMRLKTVAKRAQAASTESPQRRSKSATVGLSMSASAKVLPTRRNAGTGGSSSKNKGLARAAWGRNATSTSVPSLPRQSPLNESSDMKENVHQDNVGSSDLSISLRQQARARRSKVKEREEQGGGNVAADLRKPQWSAVSPVPTQNKGKHSSKTRDAYGGDKVVKSAEQGWQREKGRSSFDDDGENNDTSFDSLDVKILETYRRVQSKSREQQENITKSLMGEVSASVSGVAQKEEDAVDAAALSDWEMKSRLAKDRARRRKREKQARQERASVYVDGEINDDDAAMAKSGAFSLTAIPGRLAEFGGEDVESNMFGRRSSSVDHNEDEKVEDDPYGISPGGRLEIAAVRRDANDPFVPPKVLAPISNPFAKPSSMRRNGSLRSENSDGLQRGGSRLRFRSRQVRPVGTYLTVGVAANAAERRRIKRGIDAVRMERIRRARQQRQQEKGAARGDAKDGAAAAKRRGSGDLGRRTRKGQEKGASSTSSSRWLGDKPFDRRSVDPDFARKERARERARERAEKREARMLAKKQARFGGIQATVNRILAEDKKNRRRSSKAKNDDIAATEEDKDAEQRDPLSHSSVPRRKKKHSKELMSWQKNAASAAERRERGRKTMQAHKKVAKAALSSSNLGQTIQTREATTQRGADKEERFPPGEIRHLAKVAHKKPSEFDIIEKEFRASEHESRAVIDETRAFLERIETEAKAKKNAEINQTGMASTQNEQHDDDTSVDLLNALHAAAIIGGQRRFSDSAAEEEIEDVGVAGGGGGFFLTQGGFDETEKAGMAVEESCKDDKHQLRDRPDVHDFSNKQEKAIERVKRHEDKLNSLQQRFAQSNAAAMMMFRKAAADDAIGQIVATASSPNMKIKASPGGRAFAPGENAMKQLGDYAFTKNLGMNNQVLGILTPLPKIGGQGTIGKKGTGSTMAGATYQRKAPRDEEK